MNSFIQNGVLVSVIFSWAVAQALKFLITWRIEKKVDYGRFFGMGGMPSSHTAFVFSLALGVGFTEGFDSTLFALAFTLMSVVVYDAMGVRYETGKQGKVINQILIELFEGKPLTDQKLKELVGHSPLEVLGGAIVGTVITCLIFWLK